LILSDLPYFALLIDFLFFRCRFRMDIQNYLVYKFNQCSIIRSGL
jgi:hypothetical protein